MKKAIVMRGLPGSGKSTFLNRFNPSLQLHRISMDAIRLMFRAPIYGLDGQWGLSQEDNAAVAMFFYERIRERVARGETLVIDATYIAQGMINEILNVLEPANYDVAFVDFTKLPLETLLERNKTRAEHERLPENRLLELYDKSHHKPHFRNAKVFDALSETIDAELTQWLTIPTHDLSSYREIVHVGDLQGCASVLKKALPELKQDTFYIFVGDWLDRGIENGDVIEWLLEHTLGKSNVALLYGNHERHLDMWAHDQEVVAREFRLRTQEQLEEKGFDKEQVRQLLRQTVPLFLYRAYDTDVVVTHAGLSGVPYDYYGQKAFYLMSEQDCVRGGRYGDDIDAIFTQNTEQYDGKIMQVHGHRNHYKKAIVADKRSINLEGEVEFGGHLKIARFSEQGWLGENIKNETYATWRQRVKEKTEEFNKIPVPEWIEDDTDTSVYMTQEHMDNLKNHKGVLIKAMPDYPHIVSINFTKEVFFSGEWDEVLVKARGMFVNQETREVVSRSYDKFFNVGELENNSLIDLRKTITYPLDAFVKENGYLCTLGYDSQTDSLVYTSKSTTGGDFARWFKDYMLKQYSEGELEAIKNYLKDGEACMAFEMIEPTQDPHMVEYDQPQAILLDVFHRSEHERKLNYSALKETGKYFKLRVKERAVQFKNSQEFEGFVNKIYTNLAFRWKGKDIEGVVCEDSMGYQTKLKFPSYSMWKHLRTVKDFIEKQKRLLETHTNVQIGVPHNFDEWLEELDPAAIQKRTMESLIDQHQRLLQKKVQKASRALPQDVQNAANALNKAVTRENHPLAIQFVTWALTKDADYLAGHNIIQLRNAFDAEVGIQKAWLHSKYEMFNPNNTGRTVIKETTEEMVEPSDSMGM